MYKTKMYTEVWQKDFENSEYIKAQNVHGSLVERLWKIQNVQSTKYTPKFGRGTLKISRIVNYKIYMAVWQKDFENFKKIK